MSTPIAAEFGNQHGDAYGEFLEKWASKLKGVDKITDELRVEWSSDLQKILGEEAVNTLIKEVSPKWKRVGSLPDKESLDRYAQMTVKRSLFTDTEDLLERLRVRAQLPDEEVDEITAAIFPVNHLVKRARQTVAQVFDMVKDRFDRVLGKHYEDKKQLTGRRRWRTTSLNSRHKDLNLVEKGSGENFSYKGQSISGPRPLGGSPENWSNCSCFIQYERANGEWISI